MVIAGLGREANPLGVFSQTRYEDVVLKLQCRHPNPNMLTSLYSHPRTVFFSSRSLQYGQSHEKPF